MGNRDAFYRNAWQRHASTVDPNGQFDVVAHGGPDLIQIMTAKGPIKVNHRTAAIMVKNSQSCKKGQPIRLLSCSTGACSTGMGQNLANKLGVPVTAPSEILWAYPDGRMVVAPMLPNRTPDLSRIEQFNTFHPGGGRP